MKLGDRIGPYEMTDLLGEGAFGRVWAAVDARLGRKVAIKALRSEIYADADTVSRFQAEAKILAGLNHPNITTLLDIYEHDGTDVMIMEFVPGQTLESILRRVGNLSFDEALSVIVQSASGLAYAHERGLVHRDVKPANLMISEEGSVKIMDFGIARTADSQRRTKVGQAIGTPIYLSPEQCRGGEGDERSDQYSMAIVLFELLAGYPPFEADNDFDIMRAHLEAPPPMLNTIVSVPRYVADAVARAMAKQPADRFASIEEFAHAIRAEALRQQSTGILRSLVSARPETKSTTEVAQRATSSARVNSISARPRAGAAGGLRLPGGLSPVLAGAGAIGVIAVIGALGFGLGYVRDHGGLGVSASASLPAPANTADISGPVSNVISGNAISIEGKTANLFGIVDTAQSFEDVMAAQKKLSNVLPDKVLCYARPEDSYECFGADPPHKNLSVLAMELGVARANPAEVEQIHQPISSSKGRETP